MDELKVTEKWILALFSLSLLAFSNATISGTIGINYGRKGSNLPAAFQTIQFLQDMEAYRVKIFDTNPEVLKLLSGTKLQVSIMIPNEEISDIASNERKAARWISDNVLAYYPNTKIRYILVGNEVLSIKNDTTLWNNLVPAMSNIHSVIKEHNISNIKVGTPMGMDVLESTFPPSHGKFRDDISPDDVLVPLLNFLNRTRSFFFINVYPYFSWQEIPTAKGLNSALLAATDTSVKDPVSGLSYTNLLDQMLDALHFATEKIGYDNVSIAISETGWPHSGDIDQPGANIHNAATYLRNLIRKITADPPLGTPARPGVVIPTFIFSLFDEDQKPGPGTERHWGILKPDGSPLFALDLTGARADSDFPPLPQPDNNTPFRGEIWCVAANGANEEDLSQFVDSACREEEGICNPLAPLQDCYHPVSEVAHASYVFSAYWAKYRNTGGPGANCYFNGLATQTTTDPSHGSCKYPSVSL